MKTLSKQLVLSLALPILLMTACAKQPVAALESAPVATEPAVLQQPSVVVQISLPSERSNHAGDYDSSPMAQKKQVASGDYFTAGEYERPFNANTMDVYYPNIDIVDTMVYQDEARIFGVMQVKELKKSEGRYALELDTDVDGYGDYLVLVSNPASEDWSSAGAQLFEDANNDVGKPKAVISDKSVSGDGFETMVFDASAGKESDTVYARISPDDANVIEIAVLREAVGDPSKYLIGMWAGFSLLDSSLFDINDHFTHEQAGAANPGYENYYPIKQVAEIDNSCRMVVGFAPSGSEPGICQQAGPVDNTGAAPPPPSQPQQPPPPAVIN